MLRILHRYGFLHNGNIFTLGASSIPLSLSAFSTTLTPPNGLIPLLNGASVWRPTIVSSSFLIYPGLCEVIVEMVSGSADLSPFPSLSSLRHFFYFFPKFLSSFGRTWEKRCISCIRSDVFIDKFSYIDRCHKYNI